MSGWEPCGNKTSLVSRLRSLPGSGSDRQCRGVRFGGRCPLPPRSPAALGKPSSQVRTAETQPGALRGKLRAEATAERQGCRPHEPVEVGVSTWNCNPGLRRNLCNTQRAGAGDASGTRQRSPAVGSPARSCWGIEWSKWVCHSPPESFLAMSTTGSKCDSLLSTAMPVPAVTRNCLNCPPPPPPPPFFHKFATLTLAVFKYSVKMLGPNACSWSKGCRTTLLMLLPDNFHWVPLLPRTVFAEFPILRMRKHRIVAATNTVAKCSRF